MPSLKRPASTRVVRQSGYRTPFQFFLALFLSGNSPSIWRLRLIEACQELPLRVLEHIPTIGPCRFYFIQSEVALNDDLRMLAHWILFRDILQKRFDIQKHLDAFLTTFEDLVYVGQFQIQHFLETMVRTGQYAISIISTIVDPFV